MWHLNFFDDWTGSSPISTFLSMDNGILKLVSNFSLTSPLVFEVDRNGDIEVYIIHIYVFLTGR